LPACRRIAGEGGVPEPAAGLGAGGASTPNPAPPQCPADARGEASQGASCQTRNDAREAGTRDGV